MTIKVFTTEEALEQAQTAPDSMVTVTRKKNPKKFKGSEFLNIVFNIKQFHGKQGWFSAKNIELSSGLADPADKEDKRNDYVATRLQFATTVSMAGDFGKFLQILNDQWLKAIQQLIDSKTIDVGNREIKGLMQTHLSQNNAENPGGMIEDPIIRFQIKFDKFSEKHPVAAIRGKQMTEFYDARTKYVDEDGKPNYKLALVINDYGEEEPVNSDNMHKFVTKGSVLKHVRLMIQSPCISQNCVSCPIVATRVVIMPGGGGGFTDEFVDDEDEETLHNVLTAPAPAVEVANVESVTEAATVVPDQVPVQNPDIEDMLNDL